MLPEADTPERRRIEQAALAAGRAALRTEHGSIANALYRVHMTFRERFLRDRGLEGAQASRPAEWMDALIDARQLEAFVNDTWAAQILGLG